MPPGTPPALQATNHSRSPAGDANTQPSVGLVTLSLVDPKAGLVEVDSWTFHGRTRTAFDRDRARDRALLREGWRIARFTDRQILNDRVGVARELAALLGL